MGDIQTLANPLTANRPLSPDRQPQSEAGNELPADLRVVSADGHWDLAEDIFYPKFPEELKEQAPRVWHDCYWHLGYPDLFKKNPAIAAIDERYKVVFGSAMGPGGADIKLRAEHLSSEGVEQEIIYPQSLLGFNHSDPDIISRVYWIYNEYIAQAAARDPKRFFFVGVLSNWWDPARIGPAIQQIKDLGLKTYMISQRIPAKAADGQPLLFNSPELDVLWAEVAAAGLPASFHIGEGFSLNGRGAMSASAMVQLGVFRKPFAELVFSGVFDRHPNLQIVFAEGGIAWVPAMLQDAEMLYDAHNGLMDYRPMHRPSHYWHNNCYATFQNDLLGLRQMDYIGVDRVMWANDYPHLEGAFGYSRESMSSVIQALGLEKARKVLGGNARKLYRLDG